MIKLPKMLYEVMWKAAIEGMPEEVCGLLGGVMENGHKVVMEVYIMENMEHSARHFTMNPKEQIKAVKDMRKKGRLLLGNFHSHPNSPAEPSNEDRKLAYDKGASYFILSLMDVERPVLKAYHIEDEVSVEEVIEYL